MPKIKIRKELIKYHQLHRHHAKKQSIKLRDWSNYSESLKNRGDMTIWLSLDVIDQWYEQNRNILEIKYHGHMKWQKRREYGKRNNSELAIQRYKRILGNKLHARDFVREKQEAIIGCSILNKMMCIILGKIRSKF